MPAIICSPLIGQVLRHVVQHADVSPLQAPQLPIIQAFAQGVCSVWSAAVALTCPYAVLTQQDMQLSVSAAA